MDNRQFNVNGSGKEMLLNALKLAFEQKGRNTTATGYIIDPKKGMILLWHNEKGTALPAPFNAEAACNFVWTWLESEPEIECKGWDADNDHDGHNSLGWRVYCEDWGHVGHNHYAIVAVKPAYLWHGK